MQFEEIVKKFIADKLLEGRAPGTIKEYEIRLAELGTFLATEKITLQDITGADVLDFIRYLQKKGQKTQTVKNKLATFVVFNKWLVKQGILPAVIVTQDYFPKSTETRRIRRLNDEELAIFKDYVNSLQENARAAFWLMLGTGCRVGEAAHLRPVDVSLRGKSVYVDIHDAKWGSDRCIPIVDQTAARIVWEYRKTLTIDNRPLFRLSKRTLQGYATKFAQKTGITFRCHLLRHTFAALLTEQGVPMTTTQFLLGHKSLAMTAHYAQSAITDLSSIRAEI
ncbi:site-specific integrase [Lactobacillus sp. ESL0791]|uniref:tyrosine-type recombinase/integrase n=1 Tax=Lactobacillus sp. ESL0791 TaxID=2983234 RepID=UPI0023F725EF|nr:site-specific integrase [Lactobacillus sp. ESL0791]MDF7639984.1 site-specific integrase [Lactobacillus sp. ESL0791]